MQLLLLDNKSFKICEKTIYHPNAAYRLEFLIGGKKYISMHDDENDEHVNAIIPRNSNSIREFQKLIFRSIIRGLNIANIKRL